MYLLIRSNGGVTAYELFSDEELARAHWDSTAGEGELGQIVQLAEVAEDHWSQKGGAEELD